MTEHATVLSIAPTSNRDHSIAETQPLGGTVDAEVLAWIHEAQRLFKEAEHRLQTGAVLSALSSLAAVPPLHGMLVSRCSDLLNQVCEDEVPAVPNGAYL